MSSAGPECALAGSSSAVSTPPLPPAFASCSPATAVTAAAAAATGNDGNTQLAMPTSQMTTQALSGGGSHWIDHRVWGALVSMEGNGRHRLRDSPTTIGRLSSCHIVIPDERISSGHCRIYPSRRFGERQAAQGDAATVAAAAAAEGEGGADADNLDAPYVIDSSLNGTFVNHRKIPHGRKCRLRSGDEISLVLKRTKRSRATSDELKEFLATFIFQDFSEHPALSRRLRSSAGAASSISNHATQVEGLFNNNLSLSALSQHTGFGTPQRHAAGQQQQYTPGCNAFAPPGWPAAPQLSASCSTLLPPPATSGDGGAAAADVPASRDLFGVGRAGDVHLAPLTPEARATAAPLHPSAATADLAVQQQEEQEQEQEMEAQCDDGPARRRELPHIDWQWGNLIGRGAASEVYVGIDITNGSLIAIKRLNKAATTASTSIAAATAGAAASIVGAAANDLVERAGGRGAGESHRVVRVESERSLVAERSGGVSWIREASLDDDNDFRAIASACSDDGCGGSNSAAASVAVDGGSGGGDCARRPDTPMLVRRNSSANAKGLVVTPDVEAELNLLQSLSHRRIVKYLGFAVDDLDHVCILLEYVSGGSLQALITNFGSFLEPIVRIYAMQILQGVEFLHTHNVVHGDIKPLNILLTDKGQIKLSDFGTSRIMQPTAATAATVAPTGSAGGGHAAAAAAERCGGGVPTELTGTPLWMSPEMIRTQRATFESDIWAFGCVVLEMATGRQPWAECSFDNPTSAVFRIGSSRTGPSLSALGECGASEQLCAFVDAAFTLDPTLRPSASELLQHPFLVGDDGSPTTTASAAAPHIGDQGSSATSFALSARHEFERQQRKTQGGGLARAAAAVAAHARAKGDAPGSGGSGGARSPLDDIRTAAPTSDADELSPLQRSEPLLAPSSKPPFPAASASNAAAGPAQPASLVDHLEFVRAMSQGVGMPQQQQERKHLDGASAVVSSSGLTMKMKRL